MAYMPASIIEPMRPRCPPNFAPGQPEAIPRAASMRAQRSLVQFITSVGAWMVSRVGCVLICALIAHRVRQRTDSQLRA